jgi:hypothetical protein
MNRLLIFHFFFLPSFFLPSETTIPWSAEVKLKWADFQGIPSKNLMAARTFSGISYEVELLDLHHGKAELKTKVYAYFDKKKSAVRRQWENQALLDHEQLHFDIAEIHARKLINCMQSASFTSQFKEEVHVLFMQCLKEMEAMNEQYDRGTNHSLNGKEQERWNRYVKEMLL